MKYPDDFIDKVIFGDCLKILPLIPDNSIDLILTDPPYNIDYKSNMSIDKKYKENVANKTDWDKDFDLKNIPFTDFFRILKDNSFLLIFTHWNKLWDFPKPDRLLIWYKKDYGMGNLSDFSPSYEVILVYKKGNPILYFKRRPKDVLEFFKVANFSNIDNMRNKMLHPTQKPEKLIEHLVSLTTKENDIVLDCFLGSGTTAVACKKLERHFIGVEINPDYCKIAEERLSKIPNKLSSWWNK